MRLHYLSEEEAERYNRAVVPILRVEKVSFQTDDPASHHAALLVRVDVSSRPDLVDLVRVVQQEGLQKRSDMPPMYEMRPRCEAFMQFLEITDPPTC
jgi:hypothetical protein